MKVYFVRHGETVGNAARIHQTAETELSEIGRAQARFVAHRFKKIPVDLIISSDFKRTHDTAAIIQSVINKKIELTKLLRERKYPSEVEGKRFETREIKAIHTTLNAHFAEKDWHYSDEENFHDLRTRAVKFIEFISARTEKRLLAVTHGGILRMIVAEMIFGEDLDNNTFRHFTDSLHAENTGITVCEKTGEGWKLISWNDYAHLS